MHIIYLAGNSLNNQKWIQKVKSSFDSFSTGNILNYDHWLTEGKWINLQKESEKLENMVKDKEDYFVFAKSIGSVLALKNIFEGSLNPKKIIICGHPYKIAKEEKLPIDEYLESLTIPSTFIQNEFDPVFSYQDLKSVLDTTHPLNCQIINNPDNHTHDYEDFDNLTLTAKNFFGNT